MQRDIACTAQLIGAMRKIGRHLVHSRLKLELIYRMEFQAHNELKTGIFAYTEIFYDRKRWHSYNGEISQVAFEKHEAVAA